MDPSLKALTREIEECRRCARLVAHRELVAQEKRRAFRDWEYWGRPVPGFGDPRGRLLILGLAPAAHGGNRTGRVFTGDPSGDFLFPALHRAGFCNQPTSVSRDDGLELTNCYIAAAARCAPPDNKPTPDEFAACRPFLEREFALLSEVRVIVALGALAFDAGLRLLRTPRAARFGHGVEYARDGRLLLGSYHPSHRNTATGLLTAAMLDGIFARARIACDDRANG